MSSCGLFARTVMGWKQMWHDVKLMTSIDIRFKIQQKTEKSEEKTGGGTAFQPVKRLDIRLFGSEAAEDNVPPAPCRAVPSVASMSSWCWPWRLRRRLRAEREDVSVRRSTQWPNWQWPNRQQANRSQWFWDDRDGWRKRKMNLETTTCKKQRRHAGVRTSNKQNM